MSKDVFATTARGPDDYQNRDMPRNWIEWAKKAYTEVTRGGRIPVSVTFAEPGGSRRWSVKITGTEGLGDPLFGNPVLLPGNVSRK